MCFTLACFAEFFLSTHSQRVAAQLASCTLSMVCSTVHVIFRTGHCCWLGLRIYCLTAAGCHSPLSSPAHPTYPNAQLSSNGYSSRSGEGLTSPKPQQTQSVKAPIRHGRALLLALLQLEHLLHDLLLLDQECAHNALLHHGVAQRSSVDAVDGLVLLAQALELRRAALGELSRGR